MKLLKLKKRKEKRKKVGWKQLGKMRNKTRMYEKCMRAETLSKNANAPKPW